LLQLAESDWHELLAADWEKAWTFYNEVFGWQRAEAEIRETGTYQGDGHISALLCARSDDGRNSHQSLSRTLPLLDYYFNVGHDDYKDVTFSTGEAARTVILPTSVRCRTQPSWGVGEIHGRLYHVAR
jgi:hypothetical protein